MASFRAIEETDKCVIKRQEFSINDEEIDEVQIEIDEALASERSTLGQAQLMAKPKQGILAGPEMEEGELSADEFYDGNRRRVETEGSASVNNRSRREPIQITIQNKEAAKLPVSFSRPAKMETV